MPRNEIIVGLDDSHPARPRCDGPRNRHCSPARCCAQYTCSAPGGPGVNMLQAHHVGDEAGTNELRINPSSVRPASR
jgi:hypothetical protein